MSFFGRTFVFNGISCEAFDLMLYDIDDGGDSENEFASVVTIEDETVGARWRPYFYGVRHEGKLEFELTFGVKPQRIDAGRYLDRYEMSEVATWLTGHKNYLYLDIEQEDLRFVRYKAMITGLTVVAYGQIPWALHATVTCDSPYAYMYPEEYTLASGGGTLKIFNRSSLNDYYMPILTIGQSGGDFAITNVSDDDRVFQFTGLPAGTGLITVNNENCLIECANGLNLYPYFNNRFLRLKRGMNELSVSGNGTLKIICEFPINTGG